MKQRHGEGVLVLALLAALAACSDSVSRSVAPPSPKDNVSESFPPVTPERGALNHITRLVAMAMDNQPARQRLKRDMRAAPFREHKLQLTAYLSSKDGKALLGRMAALNGTDEAAIFATLSAVRPLEFYMPVAKHRESWKGNEDVLVVSQLEQWTPITAFDEAGREVSLDRKAPPTQPTLSIIPVETRFDQPMDLANSRNERDENGEAIGTLERAPMRASSLISCGDTCGGGGTGGTTIPPGLYLEFSRIVDMKEPWFRGDPEIEVHIHGPTSGSNPTYGDNLSCAGEHAPDYRKVFDQNTGFWDGRVMLYSADEIVQYTSKFTEGFHLIFWEDDNEPCTLKIDSDVLVSTLQSTAAAFGSVAIKLLPKAPWVLAAGAFVATVFGSAGVWLQTNDDFIGVAVDQRQLGSPYPGNTHVIMDGQTVNGRATIVYR